MNNINSSSSNTAHHSTSNNSQGMENIWGGSPDLSMRSPSTSSNHNHLQSLVNPNPSADSNSNTNDITPSILLEQLAFVDNFMTDFNSDFGSGGVGNAFYNGASSGDMAAGSVFGGGALNDPNQHHTGLMNAETQLAMDERLAAELSVFADETFIFPDEDKADRNDGDENSNSNNNNNMFGDSNNNNNNNKPSSEKRNLFDRKTNLLGNQYDHTRQRFSKKRSSAQNSPIADHGGFTNFDVQDHHHTSNSNGNSNNNPSNSAPGRPREPQFVPSPLTNLLAAHDLTTAMSSTSTASPAVNTAHSGYQSSTAVSSGGYESNIQMPDYSNIQTSTLVSLLPRINVPRGAYQSLYNVGFKPDQIDAIAAIIAYYERERDKFDPPVKSSNNNNSTAHSSSRKPAASSSSSSAAVRSHPIAASPPEQVQSSVTMLLDFLNEKPPAQQTVIHSPASVLTPASAPAQLPVQRRPDQTSEPAAKRMKKTDSAKKDLNTSSNKNSNGNNSVIDRYLEDSPRPRAETATGKLQGNSDSRAHKDQRGDNARPLSSTTTTNNNNDNNNTSSTLLNKNKQEDGKTSSIDASHIKNEPTENKSVEKESSGDDSGVNSESDSKSKSKSNSTSKSQPQPQSTSIQPRPKLPNLDLTKKLKEKEMETWVQELSELARDLKQRINTLEMENKLLKNLVVERGDVKDLKVFEKTNKEAENSEKNTSQ